MLKELVKPIIDALAGFGPETIEVPVKLGICGIIAIFVFFLIALAISAGSKITAYRKKLLAGIKYLNGQSPITDENVDIVYKELESHPEPVKKGWSAFLEQKVGYPSDYITSKDVFSSRKYSGKCTASKVFLIVTGLLVIIACALVGVVYDPDVAELGSFLVALQFVILPVAAYIICLLLIEIHFSMKIIRLEMTFISFCEMLDAKVVVKDRDEKEFISDNLEEINKRVDEIIAGRTADETIIEVITAPVAEAVEEVEEVVAEEIPEPAVVPEEEPIQKQFTIADMTEEDQYEYLVQLVELVDRAVADKSCTDDDYALIAATIYDDAMAIGAMEEEEPKAVIEACMYELAAAMKS